MTADITRYLNHEEVVARPASTAYRMRKYARRHRAGLVVVSAFALVLIVAAVVSVLQSIRARREAAVAQAVNDFLQNDLLAQASAENQLNANAKADPNITVRTLLDRAAQKMDGKFENQPEVKVALSNTMGAAYRDLGVYPEARQQLERALELGRRTLGADDPRTLTAESVLGQVALQQHRYSEAQALNSQVLEARRRLLGPENPATLRSMNQLGFAYGQVHKYEQAEALYSQALEIQQRVLGPESPDALTSRLNLADAYIKEGKYAQAETIDLQTLEQRQLGPGNPQTALTRYNWGCMEALRGHKDKAIALLSAAVDHGLSPRASLGLENDTDLTSLHDDPRFIALVAYAKKSAAATKQSE
jgi:tetratricopeptide (TPR) repeat protein